MPFWSDEEPTGLELGEGLLLVFLSLVILMVGILSVYLATRPGADEIADDVTLGRRSSRHSRRGSASVGSRRPRSGSRDDGAPAMDSSSNDSAPGTPPLVPSKRRSKRSMNRNRTPQTDAAKVGGSCFGINGVKPRSSAHFGGRPMPRECSKMKVAGDHGRGATGASGANIAKRSGLGVGRPSFVFKESRPSRTGDSPSVTQSIGQTTSASLCGSETGSEGHFLGRKGGLIYGLNCALNYGANSSTNRFGRAEARRDDIVEALIGSLVDTRNVSRCLNRKEATANDGVCTALRDALTDAISDALNDALTDAINDALTNGIGAGLAEGLGGVTDDDMSCIMSDIGTPSPRDSTVDNRKGKRFGVQNVRKSRGADNRSGARNRGYKCPLDSSKDTASDCGSMDQISTQTASSFRVGCVKLQNLRRSGGRQISDSINGSFKSCVTSESSYKSCCTRLGQSERELNDETDERKTDTSTIDDSSDIATAVRELIRSGMSFDNKDRQNLSSASQKVSRSFGHRRSDAVGSGKRESRSIGDNEERILKNEDPDCAYPNPELSCECPPVSSKKRSLPTSDQGSNKSPKRNPRVQQSAELSVGQQVENSIGLYARSLDQNSDVYSITSPEEIISNLERDASITTFQSLDPSTDRLSSSFVKQNGDTKKKFSFSIPECSKKKKRVSPEESIESEVCSGKETGILTSSSQNVDQLFGQRVGANVDRVGDSNLSCKCRVKESSSRPSTGQSMKRGGSTARTTREIETSNKKSSTDARASLATGARTCQRRRSLHCNIPGLCNVGGSCAGGRTSRSPSRTCGNRNCSANARL